jgi:mannan endo-1,4-beta-mannosidase
LSLKFWFLQTMTSRVNTLTGVAYKDEPAIFAWELINEPECSSDSSGETLKAWIAVMAPYMKSLDSNHMVEVGTEGYYGPNTPSRANVNPSSYAATVGTDFIMDNQVTGIDFATFHAYPDTWAPQLSESQMLVFMQNWINAHAQDAADTLKMPVLMTEFGKSNQAPNFTEALRDSFISNSYDYIYASASSGGAAAGSFVWQFIPTVIYDNYADVFAFDLSQNLSTAAIIESQSSRMVALD